MNATEQAEAMPAIRPGRWRHQQGALYDVLGVEDGGVVYSPAEDRVTRYWRSLGDFLANFDKVEEAVGCP